MSVFAADEVERLAVSFGSLSWGSTFPVGFGKQGRDFTGGNRHVDTSSGTAINISPRTTRNGVRVRTTATAGGGWRTSSVPTTTVDNVTMAWAGYVHSFVADPMVIGNAASSNGWGFDLQGTGVLRGHNPGAGFVSFPSALTYRANELLVVVYQRDSTTWKAWINNVSQGAATTNATQTPTTPTEGVHIGWQFSGSHDQTTLFAGIWTKVLSESERTAIWTACRKLAAAGVADAP